MKKINESCINEFQIFLREKLFTHFPVAKYSREAFLHTLINKLAWLVFVIQSFATQTIA